MEKLLKNLENSENLIYAIFNYPDYKITIRPIQIKNQLHYQISQNSNHQNIPSEKLMSQLAIYASDCRQAMIYTDKADYQLLKSRKGKVTLLKKPPTRTLEQVTHNRTKQYLLAEGQPIPFLIELGIMGPSGNVLAKNYHKFRQVNRFLEIVSDIIEHLPKEGHIHVVDFGCGKAVLTFALYYYLRSQFGDRLTIHGVDMKTELLQFCTKLAAKLDCKGLTFSQGSIASYKSEKPVAMVVALHACDTATDDALAKAIHWKSEVILAVPCCQHEISTQIQNETLQPLLKHGILKEKFASLVTDAARAELLEVSGYRTQVLEFIDEEHTPKNILIRAVKMARDKNDNLFQSFKQTLNILPKLEHLLKEPPCCP